MSERKFVDVGRIMDEIFEAAEEFGTAFREGKPFKEQGPFSHFKWNENMDFYPGYSYPPMNLYMTEDKSLVFEFALAGFKEDDINLQFRGDYMIFSAKPVEDEAKPENVQYFKHRLKLKPINNQRYYVPEERFNRDGVKAMFKDGILKVVVPPKEEFTTQDGVKIEIVKEGE